MSETTYYVPEPMGVHAQQDPNGEWKFIVGDGTGSVRGVSDEDHDTLESRQYAPHGEQFGETGTEQTPFAFARKYADDNGLVYMRDRYYNPATDAFISPSPHEGNINRPMSLNRYSWIGGNTR
jgi:RHS repeat-associated protein